MADTFGFARMGIGELLHRGKLAVPANQRPYAWRETEVADLLHDFNEAITSDAPEYFLGTIVLVQDRAESVPSIADGQQRLATSTVFLARIRDKLFELQNKGRARSVDTKFLREIDMDSGENVPRLKLNIEDNEFFARAILPAAYDEPEPALPAIRLNPSNARLQRASEIAKEFVDQLLTTHRPEGHADLLIRWVRFIEHSAKVVVVTVSDEVGAYRMFETLNDRGLRAGQADILKNYLYSRSASRLTEAQSMWNQIGGAIESIGDDDDSRLLTFMRHYWVAAHGPTKERELAAEIRKELGGETKTIQFLSQASNVVNDYVALWSRSNPKWTTYKNTTKEYLHTITDTLQVEQIRPLLFAVASHFDPVETDKAFRLFVSWSVRFLIFGGRGGMLDQQYSLRAQEVGTKRITKASELREAMKRYVPTDSEFEEAFGTARVSRSRLARYYLRALDKTLKGDPFPEFLANEDEATINLEHIMPMSNSEYWPSAADERQGTERMLGNMVLVRSAKNREIGNKAFSDKRSAYTQSSYAITAMVAAYETWSLDEIRDRQRRMAELAVKTWPLTLGE